MQIVSNPALAPSAMEGGNMVATNNVAMALPGSEPITPMPEAPNLLDPNLPMPKIPADQLPLSTQVGKYGGQGLPARAPNNSGDIRNPGAEPGRDGGGFTTGPQPGGIRATATRVPRRPLVPGRRRTWTLMRRW